MLSLLLLWLLMISVTLTSAMGLEQTSPLTEDSKIIPLPITGAKLNNFEWKRDILEEQTNPERADTLRESPFIKLISKLGSFEIKLMNEMFQYECSHRESFKNLLRTPNGVCFSAFLSDQWITIYQNKDIIDEFISHMDSESLGVKNYQWLRNKQKDADQWYEDNKNLVYTIIEGKVTIDLSYRFLSLLPTQLLTIKEIYEKICTLNASYYDLITVPCEITRMLTLKSLNLTANLLPYLPDLSQMMIDDLGLTNNLFPSDQIKNLPSNVKSLHLGRLGLSSPPKGVFHLTRLEYIGLYNNEISSICDAQGNNLLEDIIKRNPMIKYIDLEENPLDEKSIFKTILLSGTFIDVNIWTTAE